MNNGWQGGQLSRRRFALALPLLGAVSWASPALGRVAWTSWISKRWK